MDRRSLTQFLEQLQLMKRAGLLKKLMKMLPGPLAEIVGDADELAVRHTEAIIRSMTPRERENPEILDWSRRDRVAKGSGRPRREVADLLRNFLRPEDGGPGPRRA